MGTLEPDRRMGGWTGTGYDGIEVGRKFPPLPLTIDAGDIVRFHKCVGDVGFSLQPGDRIPAFLLNEFKVLKSQIRFPPGVLHAQEEILMQSAARIGDPLTVEIEIVDKFIRNDKRFIVIDQYVRCATDGRTVATVKHSLYWPC